MELEDRIARLDAELSRSAVDQQQQAVERQLQLWRQRVNLMNALVDVHLTRATNVDL
jgi:hypothetical protein